MSRLISSARRASVACVCVALAACLGLDTGPGLQLRWEVAEAGLEQTASASAGRASVFVRGQIPALLPCDPLKGEIEQKSSTLRVTIQVLEEVNFCAGGPATLRYVANVINLRSGTKKVIVEHQFENIDRPAEIVFEGDLTIS